MGGTEIIEREEEGLFAVDIRDGPVLTSPRR